MQWRLLKLFPQCFGAELNEDLCTDAQWLWLECQLLLDDGVVPCPSCQAFGYGMFCAHCGKRYQSEPRTCEQCSMPGTGAYCAHCGNALRSAVEDAIDADVFDWDAWATSLTPFVKGLTPQEQYLLQHDGVPHA